MNLLVPVAPRTKREAQKMATRAAIIRGAREAFLQYGYMAGTREIADTSGFSTGAIFCSFSGKEDLFAAVLDEDWKMRQDAVFHASQSDGSVVEVLTALFLADNQPQIGRQQSTMRKDAFGLWWAGATYVTAHMNSYRNTMQALAGEILEEGIGRGELFSPIDIRAVSELVWDSYVGYCHRDQGQDFRVSVEALLKGYLIHKNS